jgi:hypothetical protein
MPSPHQSSPNPYHLPLYPTFSLHAVSSCWYQLCVITHFGTCPLILVCSSDVSKGCFIDRFRRYFVVLKLSGLLLYRQPNQDLPNGSWSLPIKHDAKQLKFTKTYLVDVSALNLWHRNKMISQKITIIFTDTAHLVQTLISVEAQFFSHRI